MESINVILLWKVLAGVIIVKCKIEGCERDFTARGMCLMHYKRWRNTGNPEKRYHAVKTLKDRFDEKYKVNQDTGCWDWVASVDAAGYGQIANKHGTKKAHQLAYIFHNGDITPGMCVLHKCDNPRCVNPAHLELGTHSKNMAQMVARGRSHKGTSKKAKRLTKEQVLEIYNSDLTVSAIADKYGICREHAQSIKSKKVWRSILV